MAKLPVEDMDVDQRKIKHKKSKKSKKHVENPQDVETLAKDSVMSGSKKKKSKTKESVQESESEGGQLKTKGKKSKKPKTDRVEEGTTETEDTPISENSKNGEIHEADGECESAVALPSPNKRKRGEEDQPDPSLPPAKRVKMEYFLVLPAVKVAPGLKDSIKEHFEQFGRVKHVQLRPTNKFKTHLHTRVFIATKEAAETALASECKINGDILSLTLNEREKNKPNKNNTGRKKRKNLKKAAGETEDKEKKPKLGEETSTEGVEEKIYKVKAKNADESIMDDEDEDNIVKKKKKSKKSKKAE